jgi:hypothetical protein
LLEDHVSLDSSMNSMKINIYLVIVIKISDLKRWIWYNQDEKMKMDFFCGTQISFALAYVLSHGWSRSWEFIFKRRIQDMNICQSHNVSWVDSWLTKTYNQMANYYVRQDIVIEQEKIHGWPIKRVKIGFKLLNTWSIKNVPHRILWYGKHYQLCFMN